MREGEQGQGVVGTLQRRGCRRGRDLCRLGKGTECFRGSEDVYNGGLEGFQLIVGWRVFHRVEEASRWMEKWPSLPLRSLVPWSNSSTTPMVSQCHSSTL